MLELDDHQPVRHFRLEANYTAARLKALDETRHLAGDFEEAADKFALLEAEHATIEVRRIETQAMVETADDAWDDTVMAFQRRLLELSGNSVDAELYRRYFADIPSHVTTMSYAAEVMISRDLERALSHEGQEELRVFADRLAEKRTTLERIIEERTRLEVDEARFANRVSLAKAILNKLRRVLFASLEEVALAHGRGRDWCLRFYHAHNETLAALDDDGVESAPKQNGELPAGELRSLEGP